MKQELIDRLPNDIIHKIISYTYNVQPKELLEDIESYYYTRSILYNMAISKYFRYNWFESKQHSLDDLIIGLYHYIIYSEFKNVNKHTFYFYCHKLNGPTQTRINFIWGLLTPAERKKYFIV
jgi:hypothetical protein